MTVTIQAAPDEYRMAAGESIETAVQLFFDRFLAAEKLRIIGKPQVTEVCCPPDKSLEFTVKADLYPEVRLGQYKGIQASVKREENEMAFMDQVLNIACDNMDADVTEPLIAQKLDAMIAQEKLNIHQDSIYYLLADTTAVLTDVYHIAGSYRPAEQVKAEALDIMLQAVSSDNQEQEVPFIKAQMKAMAARYNDLSEDFDRQIDEAFERRRTKKAAMTGDDIADEAFTAYLGTIGLDEEKLRKERRREAVRAVRCDLLFDAVAQAERLTVYQDEMDAELNQIARQYQMELEDVIEGVDPEPIRWKLLRDRACKLILESAVCGDNA
ncbi:trigger factor family protein [Anaerovorax odorimutans]|uniref:Trigger factor family protein n=1 Tax=Anaerovorax odorimutans TaxID=109327 RepID=A0ABT1RPF9_9FIRM|nr:trigger factor family protein [Anaerovorax odorimutans]MCQ4637051.1 trigger factor family protein [Anaerovorax odorimutans]